MAKHKRGQGEGSIYKMSDGRWRAAVMVGWKIGPEGKRIPDRRVFTAATRHAVAEELTKALRERDRGVPIKLEKQTGRAIPFTLA